MQRLASELGCLDLLMPVFENYCKKLIMDINVSLDVISTYTLSCIVFRESEKSLDFKWIESIKGYLSPYLVKSLERGGKGEGKEVENYLQKFLLP